MRPAKERVCSWDRRWSMEASPQRDILQAAQPEQVPAQGSYVPQVHHRIEPDITLDMKLIFITVGDFRFGPNRSRPAAK